VIVELVFVVLVEMNTAFELDTMYITFVFGAVPFVVRPFASTFWVLGAVSASHLYHLPDGHAHLNCVAVGSKLTGHNSKGVPAAHLKQVSRHLAW
jgi:hypothetical protein